MSTNPFALTALYKMPGEKPEVIEVMNNVGDMDQLVQGKIETMGIDEGILVVYNNLAVKLNMAKSATIYNQDFYGPIIILEFDDNGKLHSLDPANIDYYSKMLEDQ